MVRRQLNDVPICIATLIGVIFEMPKIDVESPGLVSVIVPVFHPEEDLFRLALDSLCRQTYQSLEIIVVDDGNTGEHRSIVDRVSLCDPRIRVIRCKHEGQSAARNAGIQNARGRWITFVDSDDRVSRDFIREAVEALTKYGLDAVLGQAHNITPDACRMDVSPDCSLVSLISGDEEIDGLRRTILSGWPRNQSADPDYYCHGPWSKVYKVDVLKRASFNSKLEIAEDVIHQFEVLRSCRSVGIVDGTWYWRICRVNSVSHARSEDFWIRGIDLVLDMELGHNYQLCQISRASIIATSAAESIIGFEGASGYSKVTRILSHARLRDCFAKELSIEFDMPLHRRFFYRLISLGYFRVACSLVSLLVGYKKLTGTGY